MHSSLKYVHNYDRQIKNRGKGVNGEMVGQRADTQLEERLGASSLDRVVEAGRAPPVGGETLGSHSYRE